jgi:hypothetical protein
VEHSLHRRPLKTELAKETLPQHMQSDASERRVHCWVTSCENGSKLAGVQSEFLVVGRRGRGGGGGWGDDPEAMHNLGLNLASELL